MKEIAGFLHPIEIALLAKEAAKVKGGQCIVEVGSYLGKSTAIFSINSSPGAKVYAIDTWDNRGMGNIEQKDTYAEFTENMKSLGDASKKIRPIRGDSFQIGKSWDEPINLLFLDGNHSLDAVTRDLESYVPWMDDGGVLLMHDYTENCGVRPAFDKYMEKVTSVGKLERSIVGSILRVEF